MNRSTDPRIDVTSTRLSDMTWRANTSTVSIINGVLTLADSETEKVIVKVNDCTGSVLIHHGSLSHFMEICNLTFGIGLDHSLGVGQCQHTKKIC